MSEKTTVQKLDVSIDHSEPGFFSDSITVSHNPHKFVFDFTQTIPRFDSILNERKQSLTIKHKTIIMDPVVAKDFLRVLKENIKKFEKNFGKIEVKKPVKSKRLHGIVSEPVESNARNYIG